MPRPCHALTTPLFSRPRHSMAVERRLVGYLPAFSFFRLPCRVLRRLLSEAYQSQDAGGQCETKRLSWRRKRVVAAHYKKDDLLNCWTSSSDISGYHVDFHEGHSTVGAWHGRGTVWALHAMYKLALTVHPSRADECVHSNVHENTDCMHK